MKVLLASQAIAGHFNPLTGIGVRLKDEGHDVGWYTGGTLAGKLEELNIAHYPFVRAIEHTADNLPALYPQRARLKGPRAIRFDGERIFASNLTNFFEDIRDVQYVTKPARDSYVRQLAGSGLRTDRGIPITDEPYRWSDAVIQTGTASLDFPRQHNNPACITSGRCCRTAAARQQGTRQQGTPKPQAAARTPVPFSSPRGRWTTRIRRN